MIWRLLNSFSQTDEPLTILEIHLTKYFFIPTPLTDLLIINLMSR